MPNLTEYRCTRNSLYQHYCIGRDDVGARQGHYVVACCRRCALEVMALDYPKDRHGFTAEPSKPVDWLTTCESCGCDETGRKPE